MKEQLISFKTAKLAKEKGAINLAEKGQIGLTNIKVTQSSLQQWLREKHNIFLESKQKSFSDTEWTVVNIVGKILIPSEIYMYYDGYPVKDHICEHTGLEEVLQKSLKLIKL